MSTKRVPLRRETLPRFSPRMVGLYRQCRAMLADGTGKTDGSRRAEFLELFGQLHLLLHLPPNVLSPLDVSVPEPPGWMRPFSWRCEAWRRSWALRQALEAAVTELEEDRSF